MATAAERSAPADEPFDLPGVERALIAAIEKGDYPRAGQLLQKLARFSKNLEPVVAELFAPLEAMSRGAWDEAFFRITEETTFDSTAEDKMLEVTARNLEQSRPELAIMAWHRWRGTGGHGRAEALERKAKLGEEAARAATREAAIAYYRGRIADRADAAGWERLGANLLAKSDYEGALEACNRSCQLDPARPLASQLVADTYIRLGHERKAIEWLENVGRNNPGKAWPWLHLATLYLERLLDFPKAIDAASRALEEQPDDRGALKMLHVSLRKAQRWHDLVAHLERMTGATMRMTELGDLYQELGDVTANHLNSPLEAVELRKQAEFFRDQPAVVAFYWQSLAEAGDDPETVAEAEQFFRVNELWGELGKLLVKKLDRVSGAELLDVIDELALAVVSSEGASRELLVHTLKNEIGRARDPEIRTQLEARLAQIEAPPADEEEEPGGLGLLPLVAGVVVAIGIVGIAVVALFLL